MTDKAALRGVLLPVLNDAVGRDALTRREVHAVLDSLSAAEQRDQALNLLSAMTAAKWKAEDALGAAWVSGFRAHRDGAPCSHNYGPGDHHWETGCYDVR